MTAKLSFSIDADQQVWVVVRAPRNAPTTCRVSATEAKRFAWSMLADLDPDEANLAGAPPPEDAVPRPRGTVHERERAAFATQPRKILAFLRNGNADTRRIAVAVDISTQQASVVLCNMAKRQLVTRLTKGVAGYPAIWSAGPSTLEAYEAAKRAGTDGGPRAYAEIPNEPVTPPSPYLGEARA